MVWPMATERQVETAGERRATPRGAEAIVGATLDAAERLFGRDGPDAVSLRAIADEAGITYSLVNRHLGTKADIVDALLARSEQRWRAAVDGVGYREAIGALLGPDAETGGYIRLLAWSLLSGEGSMAAHRRHTRLHELLPLVDDAAGPPDEQLASALALVLGWRFFHPFVLEALRLGPEDEERLHEAIRRAAATGVSRERRG